MSSLTIRIIKVFSENFRNLRIRQLRITLTIKVSTHKNTRVNIYARLSAVISQEPLQMKATYSSFS